MAPFTIVWLVHIIIAVAVLVWTARDGEGRFLLGLLGFALTMTSLGVTAGLVD